MPLCQSCGVNMTASEVTQRRDGLTGDWHTDCAYLDYLADTVTPTGDDSWANIIIIQKEKLAEKRNGISVDFP